METSDAGLPRPVRGAPVSITVTPDGPLIVRGDAEIVDEHGDAIPRHRATVALCRCGRSSIQPYCDGSHAVGRSAVSGD